LTQWYDNWDTPFCLACVFFLISADCWLVIDPRPPVFGSGRTADVRER